MSGKPYLRSEVQAVPLTEPRNSFFKRGVVRIERHQGAIKAQRRFHQAEPVGTAESGGDRFREIAIRRSARSIWTIDDIHRKLRETRVVIN